MKKALLLVCVFALLCSLLSVAAADIGQLHFSSLTEGTIDHSDKLPQREYDPDGSIYPLTGLGEGDRKHTVMLYLVGADLESGGSRSSGGAATRDLLEIIGSDYDQSRITVLVMAGGATKWFNSAVDINDTAVYEVVDDSLVKRETNGVVGMGNADTLSRFINYGYQKYPAEKYSLILWDHGGGPLGGLMLDHVSGDHFKSVLEVKNALEQTPAAQEKLYLLGFDACLEGSVEIANVFSPYAHQLVVSEESEPGLGWNYQFLKELAADESPAETAARVVDLYFEQYKSADSLKLTLSSINLDKIQELTEKSKVFFEAVSHQLNAGSFSEFAALRQQLEPVSMDNKKLDLVDLTEMVEAYGKYAPDEAADLTNMIQETIQYEKHNQGVSSGLSVYFPYYDSNKYYKINATNYEKLGFDSGYTGFIDSFNLIQRDSSGVNWNLMNKSVGRDTRTNFTLQLTAEQAENLAEYSLVILQKMENEDTYVVVKPDGTAELNGDQLTGNYVHSALYAVNDKGEICHDLPLVWTRNAAGYYVVPAKLIADDMTAEIQMICKINDQTNEISIIDLLVNDEENGYYSNRTGLDTEMYQSIQFSVPVYKETQDENGLLTGVFDWEVERVETYTFDIHGDWTLSMVQDTIDPSQLYAAFVLTDYYRMTHTSPLIPVIPSEETNPVFVLTYDDDYLRIDNLVSTNNNDVYILFTVDNPGQINETKNEQEVFVHIDQVVINGTPVEAEIWFEGDGSNEGIPAGGSSTDTLVLSGMGTDGLETIQSIEFRISVVNAANDEVISEQQATGYLRISDQ